MSRAQHILRIEDDDIDEDGFYEIPLIDITEEDGDARASDEPIETQRITARASNRDATNNRFIPSSVTATVVIQSFRLCDGTVIRVADAVELKKPETRTHGLQSGDFLKVSRTLQDLRTGTNYVQGLKYKREKYVLGKSSDGQKSRLNELVLYLETREDDNRPAEIQGLVTVSMNEILRKRDIVCTQKPYPMLSFRDQPPGEYVHMRRLTESERRKQIFDRGPLVCRWARESIISPNGKIYGGVLRHLRKHEVTVPQHLQQIAGNPQHKPSIAQSPLDTPVSIPIIELPEARGTQKLARPPSLEYIEHPPQRGNAATTKNRYTFLDLFSGAGGASRGADNAGLTVLGGLDHNQPAMNAWKRNNPEGRCFPMEMSNFFESGQYKLVGRPDIASVSPCCQPYSGAHTIPGKDDEANIATLQAVPLVLQYNKPRILVMENTAGLVNIKKNTPFFTKVLRDIISSGYDLKYKILNMADYRLSQPRKRVVVLAARNGVPMPPFPKPTNGPEGSGLKPHVSIGDALCRLERLGQRAMKDPYHQPQQMKRLNKPSYDAFTKFVDCIMTSGVRTPHPSGRRDFTPRELACLQSLPIHHHLAGSRSEAIKQVGNMFPPLMAELIYMECARTLEAFDNGMISAEEEIFDLNITLIEKGIEIPEQQSEPTSVFDLTGSTNGTSRFRYLSRPQLTDTPYVLYPSPWATRKLPQQRRPFGRRVPEFHDPELFDGLNDGIHNPIDIPVRLRVPTWRRRQTEKGSSRDNAISISDSE